MNWRHHDSSTSTGSSRRPTAAVIEIVRGRNFHDADRPDTQPVVIVSEAMVRRFWTDGDAVGRLVRGATTLPPGSSSVWRATRR